MHQAHVSFFNQEMMIRPRAGRRSRWNASHTTARRHHHRSGPFGGALLQHANECDAGNQGRLFTPLARDRSLAGQVVTPTRGRGRTVSSARKSRDRARKGNHNRAVQVFEKRAQEAEAHSSAIRQLLLRNSGSRRNDDLVTVEIN